MKRALVHTPTARLCQVMPMGQEFPVAPDLQWHDCADDVTPETHNFDGTNFVPKPVVQPPPPIDLSNLDNLERTLKAQALIVRDYCNALKDEVRGLAVLLVNKGHITAQEAGALLVYDGSGAQDQKTVDDLKADFAAKYEALG